MKASKFLFIFIVSMAFATPAHANLEDVETILKLHQQVLDAHISGDLESWMATEADDYVMANRGTITFPTKADRSERIGPYLENTKFTEYRDLSSPIIRVSDDRSLAWLIAEVKMAGVHTNEDGSEESFDSIWAWIELFERRDGQWLRVGNVSNRRP